MFCEKLLVIQLLFIIELLITIQSLLMDQELGNSAIDLQPPLHVHDIDFKVKAQHFHLNCYIPLSFLIKIQGVETQSH